ncbi:hypothetical protein Vafri_8851, partial [Volvox africanus]
MSRNSFHDHPGIAPDASAQSPFNVISRPRLLVPHHHRQGFIRSCSFFPPAPRTPSPCFPHPLVFPSFPRLVWHFPTSTTRLLSSTLQLSRDTASATHDSVNPHSNEDQNRRRLELLALDVEYTHVELPDGSRRSFASWVALVDRFEGVPLKTHIALPTEGGEGGLPLGTRIVGGVPRAALTGAPSLTQVRDMVSELLRRGCRVLVGHGLTKDLRALGIGDRAAATLRRRYSVRLYDTMSYGKFRGRGGTARSLAWLAAEFLDGRKIQAAGPGCHDPEEDARAVLDLYVRYVDYSYLVEYETARILAEHRRRNDEAGDEVAAEEEVDALLDADVAAEGKGL